MTEEELLAAWRDLRVGPSGGGLPCGFSHCDGCNPVHLTQADITLEEHAMLTARGEKEGLRQEHSDP